MERMQSYELCDGGSNPSLGAKSLKILVDSLCYSDRMQSMETTKELK